MAELDKSKAVELLNRILEAELARVVRYTHYSLLVFGFNRIPIVACASKPPSHWPMHSRPERWSPISASIRPSRSDRCAIRPDGHRHYPARIAPNRSAALALYRELQTVVEVSRSCSRSMLGRGSRPKNCMRARSTRCFASRVQSPRFVLTLDNRY
jgi:bacterioferritin